MLLIDWIFVLVCVGLAACLLYSAPEIVRCAFMEVPGDRPKPIGSRYSRLFDRLWEAFG